MHDVKQRNSIAVRNGREVLSIPGPTTIPDEVLSAMHRPAIDIYSGELFGITASCHEDLRKIFRTKEPVYIYTANGHGAWEAALTNTLSRGDKILVLESGRFAVGWGEMGSDMGVEVEILPRDIRRAVDPAAVKARLAADRGGTIKAVLVVQVDTASGVVNDIPAIRAAMTAAGHDALLMVDTIASLAIMPFEMDEWGVDIAVGASQKGLMVPPGLSFVAGGPKAKAAHKKAGLRTRYWDWTAREGSEHYNKYCGTAPMHLLFGLRKSLDMILAEGLDNIFERHRLLAGAVRHAVDTWAKKGALEYNILEARERADSVTTIRTDEGKALQSYCKTKCGVVLGTAIGDLRGRGFRIAHMGHINAPMILGTLGAVEMGLVALGIPHGRGGVDAAVQWLGNNVPADSA